MASIRYGLCSVTLRERTPAQVIETAVAAGLDCIEWGGDVHVPPGDTALAGEVATRTADAGLQVASYGSYFRAVETPDEAFEEVVATAAALGAPRIRVWAGGRGSADAGADHREGVAASLRRAADLAAARGIELGLEYHGNTLTDTLDSTVALLAEVGRDNVASYWQPRVGMADADTVADLVALGPCPTVHAFSWDDRGGRLPLVGRESMWRGVGGLLARRDGPVDVLLEFVADHDPANVVRDGRALRDLLGSRGGPTAPGGERRA